MSLNFEEFSALRKRSAASREGPNVKDGAEKASEEAQVSAPWLCPLSLHFHCGGMSFRLCYFVLALP